MEKPAWNADVLDWLAEDFADHGYDVKHLIGVMLASRAYQMPAVAAAERAEVEFVFHGPEVRRLSAEQFRDAIGSLTGDWYGQPSAKLIAADGHTNEFAVVRAALVGADSLQIALGRPNREQVVTVRSPTATTLQALELTNGAELADHSCLAARKQDDSPHPRRGAAGSSKKSTSRRSAAGRRRTNWKPRAN